MRVTMVATSVREQKMMKMEEEMALSMHRASQEMALTMHKASQGKTQHLRMTIYILED